MNLVSGATGFIGRRLFKAMQADGVPCRGLSRLPLSDPTSLTVDLGDQPALTAACAGVTSVFHCAGYAHAFGSLTAEDAAMHWQVNFEGTRNLVEAAGNAGVRRFVFLSSVKAMAEPGESCADEDFPGLPETAYGQAKRAAEAAVLEAGQRHDMLRGCRAPARSDMLCGSVREASWVTAEAAGLLLLLVLLPVAIFPSDSRPLLISHSRDFAIRAHCVCGLKTLAAEGVRSIIDYSTGARGRYHIITAIPIHGYILIQLACACVRHAVGNSGMGVVDLGVRSFGRAAAQEARNGKHGNGGEAAEDKDHHQHLCQGETTLIVGSTHHISHLPIPHDKSFLIQRSTVTSRLPLGIPRRHHRNVSASYVQ